MYSPARCALCPDGVGPLRSSRIASHRSPTDPGRAARDRARDQPRPVLSDHRADHQRADRSPPGRDQATDRPQCRAGVGADPGLRVPPGRGLAGGQRVRRVLGPGQPDLDRARGGEADGRLRPRAAPGLRRAGGPGLRRDRDGPGRVARADHPRGGARRPGQPRPGPRTSRSARGGPPTCSSACSTATPTCTWSGRPTSSSITCMAENLPEFARTHQVIEDEPAWEGGPRGVLTAKRAREEGFAKLIADTPVGGRQRLPARRPVRRPTTRRSARS